MAADTGGRFLERPGHPRGFCPRESTPQSPGGISERTPRGEKIEIESRFKNAEFFKPGGAFGVECAWFLPKDKIMDQERRRAPRIPFIASAEVLAESASTRLAARISDISATGCYVDTINPLVDGTAVRLKILTATRVFEAPATVVYSHTHLGMGLMFGEVLPNSQDVLQNWLPAGN